MCTRVHAIGEQVVQEEGKGPPVFPSSVFSVLGKDAREEQL